jgi:hypothetical protein
MCPEGAMWPDDFIGWARVERPFVAGSLERLLHLRLETNPEWSHQAISALADQATRHAFDVANDHRRYPEYCRTQAEFRTWAYVSALNEALRLLIRHRFGEPRFLLLSADHRRVLGMRYLDQLPLEMLPAYCKSVPMRSGNRHDKPLRHSLRFPASPTWGPNDESTR